MSDEPAQTTEEKIIAQLTYERDEYRTEARVLRKQYEDARTLLLLESREWREIIKALVGTKPRY